MRFWAALSFAALGCGSAPSPAGDPDAGADAGPQGFDPAPPAPPVFTPCPDGWREVADADDPNLVTCDPWPAGGAETCAASDEAHFPGEPGCGRIGTPCPAGDFPEDLPGGAVVYVRPGAVGGNGAEATPFGTIAAALAGASDGTVVALAKGTYDEPVSVHDAVTLRGACVAETILAVSTASDLVPTVTARGGARLENLTVTGARAGVQVAGGEAVTLSSVVVDGTVRSGVVAYGDAVLEDVVVRDVVDTGKGDDTKALEAQQGAEVHLTRVVLSRNETGIHLLDAGTLLVATALAVLDSEGHAIDVETAAQAEISASALERGRQSEIETSGSIALTDVVVRDTRGTVLVGAEGLGLDVLAEGDATLARVAIDGTRAIAVSVSGAGSTLAATDFVVRDTLTQDANDALGLGLAASGGASVTLERAVFARDRAAAIGAVDAGTSVACTDVSVRDVLATGSGDGGYGVQGYDGVRFDFVRTEIVRSRGFGLVLLYEGTTAFASDLLVEGIVPADFPDGESGFGTGLSVIGGATLDVSAFRVSAGELCGVQLATGGEVDLHDGEVSGNAIGANVQTEGFDVSRLQDGVAYLDNGVALDAAALPVPEPASVGE